MHCHIKCEVIFPRALTVEAGSPAGYSVDVDAGSEWCHPIMSDKFALRDITLLSICVPFSGAESWFRSSECLVDLKVNCHLAFAELRAMEYESFSVR